MKNPTLFELFGSADNFVGNPNLKPEQAESWEIGFEQSFFKDKLKIDAVFFDNQIKDLIQGSSTTATNIAGSSIHGVELGIRARPLKNLDLIFNYTWMTSEQESGDDVGSVLVRRPKHKANMNAIYRFHQDKANVGLNFIYNGKAQDFDFDNSGGFSFSNRSLTTLDEYYLVNLTGSYKLHDKIKLFARIENLFDQRYEEVFDFGRPGIAGYAGIKMTY